MFLGFIIEFTLKYLDKQTLDKIWTYLKIWTCLKILAFDDNFAVTLKVLSLIHPGYPLNRLINSSLIEAEISEICVEGFY